MINTNFKSITQGQKHMFIIMRPGVLSPRAALCISWNVLCADGACYEESMLVRTNC